MTVPSTLKPSALVAAAHIIASDGPGEVVRKLDAAFDVAVAHRSGLPSGAACLGTYRNVDDGATYTWGSCEDGFFRLDQFGWATWPTQEGFSRALLLAAAPQAQAHEAPAAPATPAQVQALHRARRALYAIGKTYDDSELRTRALEADEEIDRMLAAAPQAPTAPVEAQIAAVMELVKDWSQRDLIAAESGIDELSGESSEKEVQDARRLGAEAEAAYRAIETALRILLAAAPAPPIKGAWISSGYVIVTPAGTGQAKAVKAAILAALPMAPAADQAITKGD